MFIHKHKIFKTILIIVLLAMYSYTIRYLVLTTYDIDILDVINYPYISFWAYVSIHTFKYVIKGFLDYILLPNVLFMNAAPNNNQGGGGVNNAAPGQGNPPILNPIAVPADPTGIGANVQRTGWLNPATGLPYATYQPYATNLANAMDQAAIQWNMKTCTLDPSDVGQTGYDFFHHMMAEKFPDRRFNHRWNSGATRKALRELS